MTRVLKALCIVALGVTVACSGETSDQGGRVADPTENASSAISQLPHTAACQEGIAPIHCKVRIRVEPVNGALASSNGPTGGLWPADLVDAYKLDIARSPGATIAVVDAFGYPSAESDLARYRSYFGLRPCTIDNLCLRIVNAHGQTSPLPPEPNVNDDWTIEAALDLAMASAACPNCNLLLVLADNDSSPDDTGSVYAAQQTAANLGATVISNSWGGVAANPSAEEHYFQVGGNVGIFVGSGDSGYTGDSPDYPSTSAFVTAVGGTSLTRASNARGWVETAWSNSGSSCSKDTDQGAGIPKPGYQGNTGCARRAAADVSAFADPSIGVAIYNTGPLNRSQGKDWIVVGGTSASGPFVAGVYALYGKGGVGPSYSYSNPSQYFDVTSGSNGSCSGPLCNAGAGWDGPTGNGSPNFASAVCTPQCGSRTCGSDGCGGTCGKCAVSQTCDSGQCVDDGPGQSFRRLDGR